jgi:predicted nucleotidyltransferase
VYFATLEDARILAEELKRRSTRVSGVELFGSVEKDGRGHDVDFVVIVDPKLAKKWWKEMRYEVRVRMGTRWLPLRRIIKKYCSALDEAFIKARKKHREVYASQLLGVDLATLGRKQRTTIDIFLLPEGWRHGKNLNAHLVLPITGVGDHRNTRMFLESIARQAVPF